MRFIKLGLLSVFFLFLLMTAISLLIPSTVHVNRSITISAPFNSVYSNINDLSKWKNWYANYESSHTSLSKKTIGNGASLTINTMRITILSSSQDKIKTVWQSGKQSFEGEFIFLNESNASDLTVQWRFIRHIKWYPWEKLAAIVSDKVIGPGMEKSLENLKAVLEK